MTTRHKILKADDRRREAFELPEEWGGGTVYIRELSGTDRDQFEAYALACADAPLEALRLLRALLAVMSLVNEKGKPIFRDKDVEAVGRKSSRILDQIWDRAMAINQMGKRGGAAGRDARMIRDPKLLRGLFAGIAARQEERRGQADR